MVNPPSTVNQILPLQSILTPTHTQLRPRPLPRLSAMHSPQEAALALAARLAAAMAATEALPIAAGALLRPGVPPMPLLYVIPRPFVCLS
jgi:hypothetical protein